jgi:hypothetical protein
MKVQIFTTAPADYDYADTLVLTDDVAVDDRGRKLRLVEIPDERKAETQSGRYGSGLFYAREKSGFIKDVEAGLITMCPKPVHYYRITFDVREYHEWDETKQNKLQALLDRHQAHLRAEHGGLIQHVLVRGQLNVFERIVADFKNLGVPVA